MSARPGPVDLPARLGWVSFFNDCSSEVLARVLPLYLTAVAGVSPAFVGMVEGLADSAAIFLKGISGWLSDRAASRKGFVLGGYTLSVAARGLYLLALSPWLLGLSRVLDRVGKGLRSAPRDAMVADAAAQGGAGRAFGINRFLDTLGAMGGLALVLALGVGRGPISRETFLRCAWIALPVGLVALALLVFWVPRVPRAVQAPRRLAWHVPREIRGFLALVFLFGLANSSDAFLVLRARECGFGLRGILGLFLVFNALAALLALPAGRLSDRWGRTPFLVAGWGVYALAYGVMATCRGPLAFAAALLFYGAFYGLTEGVEKAFLADLLKPEHRGTGFGAFQTATGLAALVSSPLMGLAMALLGTRVAFLATAGVAASALVGLVVWSGRRR
jgi:MFS family permease